MVRHNHNSLVPYSIVIAGELPADRGCSAEGCPVPAVGGVGDGHARHVAGAAQGEAWAW